MTNETKLMIARRVAKQMRSAANYDEVAADGTVLGVGRVHRIVVAIEARRLRAPLTKREATEIWEMALEIVDPCEARCAAYDDAEVMAAGAY